MKNSIYIKHLILCFLGIFSIQCYGQEIDSLKLALKKAKHDTIRCSILNQLAETASEEEWPQFNQQLLLLCEEKVKSAKRPSLEYTRYESYLANAYNNAGLLAETKGKREEALEFYNRSLKIHNAHKNRIGAATTLNNLAIIYQKKGDVSKSIEMFSKCLELNEELKYWPGVAHTLNNLATIYYEQDNLPKSLEFYQKGLKVREENNYSSGIASTISNIGMVYRKMNKFEEAISYFKKGYDIQEKEGDKSGLAATLNNIGGIYQRQGNYIKAEECFLKSLTISEETKTIELQSSSLVNLAGLYIDQKKYDKALIHCKKSIEIARQLGFPEDIKDGSRFMYDIYKATGNYKLALENYEVFIAMRDSINNIETQKSSIKQQAAYEYKQQKAIEDTKHEAELKQQEEKATEQKNKQYIIIAAVSVVLIVVAFFSFVLYKRYKLTQSQNKIIDKQKKEVEQKQKEILDSIHYAKRIQQSLMPTEKYIERNFKKR